MYPHTLGFALVGSSGFARPPQTASNGGAPTGRSRAEEAEEQEAINKAWMGWRPGQFVRGEGPVHQGTAADGGHVTLRQDGALDRDEARSGETGARARNAGLARGWGEARGPLPADERAPLVRVSSPAPTPSPPTPPPAEHTASLDTDAHVYISASARARGQGQEWSVAPEEGGAGPAGQPGATGWGEQRSPSAHRRVDVLNVQQPADATAADGPADDERDTGDAAASTPQLSATRQNHVPSFRGMTRDSTQGEQGAKPGSGGTRHKLARCRLQMSRLLLFQFPLAEQEDRARPHPRPRSPHQDADDAASPCEHVSAPPAQASSPLGQLPPSPSRAAQAHALVHVARARGGGSAASASDGQGQDAAFKPSAPPTPERTCEHAQATPGTSPRGAPLIAAADGASPEGGASARASCSSKSRGGGAYQGASAQSPALTWSAMSSVEAAFSKATSSPLTPCHAAGSKGDGPLDGMPSNAASSPVALLQQLQAASRAAAERHDVPGEGEASMHRYDGEAERFALVRGWSVSAWITGATHQQRAAGKHAVFYALRVSISTCAPAEACSQTSAAKDPVRLGFRFSRKDALPVLECLG